MKSIFKIGLVPNPRTPRYIILCLIPYVAWGSRARQELCSRHSLKSRGTSPISKKLFGRTFKKSS